MSESKSEKVKTISLILGILGGILGGISLLIKFAEKKDEP